MSHHFQKTDFEVLRTVEPFYLSGPISIIFGAQGPIVGSCVEQNVHLTELMSAKRLHSVEGDTEELTSLVISHSGEFLVTCSRSLLMKIYQLGLSSPNLRYKIRAHDSPVMSICCDETSTLVATGGSEGHVKVWDLRGGYNTHTFKGHGMVVTALCFFGNKDEYSWILASGSTDKSVRIWDLVSSSCLSVLNVHTSVVTCLSFDASGANMISASRDGTVVFWRVKKRKSPVIEQTLPVGQLVESCGFLSLDYSKKLGYSNQLFYVGGSAGNIKIYHSASSDCVLTSDLWNGTKEVEMDERAITYSFYNAKEESIISVHTSSLLFNHLLLDNGSLKVESVIPGHHDEIIDCCFVGSSEENLAVATNTSELRILSPTSSSCMLLTGHTDTIICIDRSSDGCWIATGSKDKSARVWRMNHEGMWECEAVFQGHTGSIGALGLSNRVSGNPKFLITGSSDRTVKYWTINPKKATSRAVHTKLAHDKDINAIDVHSLDRLFATASQDRTVKIWNADDCEITGVLKGHKRGVWSCEFSSHAKRIVTSSGDRTVKVWNYVDCTCSHTFEGHTNSVLKVIWMSKDQQIASSGGDGLVKIWNVQSNECCSTLDNHSDRVWSLALNREEDLLVSGGGDSIITFWHDITAKKKEENSLAISERVEQEQELANYIVQEKWRDAIILALTLDQPTRLLSLFKQIAEIENADEGSTTGLHSVDQVVTNLSHGQLVQLLRLARDWNVTSKTSDVSQRIFYLIFSSFSVKSILQIEDIEQIFDSALSYSKKHLDRIEKLIEKSYSVDFVYNILTGGVDSGSTDMIKTKL